jgi:ABC-2 type transport system ATP-binding protein
MTSMPAIAVRDLVKRYGDASAVDGVSFAVERGEVYGLLGANGAGKTTTVEILEGHRQRTSGSVSVLGFDPADRDRGFRDSIGIVLQSAGVERVLTVGEVLSLYAPCYRRSRPVDECLALVGLEDSAGKRCDRLSGGQRRRLDLALGIIGCPEVLFLDEPTAGFDPAARRGAWDLIRELCSGGTTVLLTSHYLDEVEQLADRVGVMRRGRMIAEGSPAELTSATGDTVVRFRPAPGLDAGALAALLDSDAHIEDTVGEVVITTPAPTVVLHALTGWALEHGHDLDGLVVQRPSLEDLFLALAGDDSVGGADG